jgi:hypothetical protein
MLPRQFRELTVVSHHILRKTSSKLILEEEKENGISDQQRLG